MTTVTYSLQPDPQWRFFTLTGDIASGCKMYTKLSSNHAINKAVYQDPDGNTAWPNPVIFDSTGAKGPFYWADDAPYYIEIQDAVGNVLWTQDDFPTNSANTPTGETANGTNYILNSQLRLFPLKSYTNPVPASISTLAFGGWSFSKTNTTATDTLKFLPFILGQTTVPNNPVYYLNYACTGAGSGETTKDIIYSIPDVGTFASQEINLQLEGQSASSSSIEILVNQHFGTGGSPSSDVTTPIATIALTPAMAPISAQVFTPPSVAGKTLGTNNDDSFQLIFRMPLNTTCNVSIALPDLQVGDIPFTTQVVTEQQAAIQSVGTQYPLVNSINPLDGCYDPILLKGQYQLSFIARAGKMIDWPINTAPASYSLLCNGLMYFSQDYYNLANICFDSAQNDSLTIGKLAWGTGLSGFVADAAGVVTCTNSANGAVVTPAADFDSKYGVIQTQTGSASTPGIATIICRTGDDTVNSSYFILNSASTAYYVWFDLNNTGVAPAPPGRTAIEINFTGTETSAEMAALLAAAISTGITSTAATTGIIGTCFSDGVVTPIVDNNTTLQIDQISVGGVSEPGIFSIAAIAGSSIVNGSWLLINSPTKGYYLWFSLNNETYDPGLNQTSLVGKKGIKVVYTGSETANQMAVLIAQQISCAQFRVPDVRGLTPRYWQDFATVVLPFPSQIKIFSVGNDSGITFDISGFDEDGNSLPTENLTGATAGNTVTSANTYGAITAIIPSGNTASTAYVGIDGEAILPSPSKITITSIVDETAVTFTINGTDQNGEPQSESLVGGNNTTVTSALTYTTVLSIQPDIITTSTITAGINADDSICLSQSGAAVTNLIINGQSSLIAGIAPSQSGTAGNIMLLNGVLSRDPDYYARLSLYSNIDGTFESATGDNTGSLQLDNFKAHGHAAPADSFVVTHNGSGGGAAGGFSGQAGNTLPAGGPDTRPKNINLNKIIYY